MVVRVEDEFIPETCAVLQIIVVFNRDMTDISLLNYFDLHSSHLHCPFLGTIVMNCHGLGHFLYYFNAFYTRQTHLMYSLLLVGRSLYCFLDFACPQQKKVEEGFYSTEALSF